jgi:hypothetical protein
VIQPAPIYTFDAAAHAYHVDGVRVPSITQLLDKGGLVNGAAYFTEESRRRGHAVHSLCMDFELGNLTLERLESPYRGYVLGYVEAVTALKPTWDQIEIFDIHPTLRFGGRPDRVGQCFARYTVAEIKSAAKAKHHAVQTALQAILVGGRHGLPKAEDLQRLVIYVKANGKYSIESHENKSDFLQAHQLIREFCL